MEIGAGGGTVNIGKADGTAPNNLNVTGALRINNMPFSYSGVYFFDYYGGGTQVITQLPTNLPNGKYLFSIPDGPTILFFSKSGTTFTQNTSNAPDGYDTNGSPIGNFQATYSTGYIDTNGTVSLNTSGWDTGRKSGTWTVTQDLRIFPRTQRSNITSTKTF